MSAGTAQPVTVAFCITDLDAGGAERALVQIVTRLNRAEWNPSVFCLSPPGELVDVLEQHEIPVTCFHATGKRSISVLWKLRRALKEIRPRIVVSFLFHANMAARLASFGLGAQVVSGIRVSEKRSLWPLRLDRWTEKLVARHVCVSQAVADYSIETGGLPTEKVRVIPNGVDYAAFANCSQIWDRQTVNGRIPQDAPIVLFVGRLSPQKAPEVFLEALATIFQQHPEAHAVLVGEGPLQASLEQQADDLSIRDRTHFLGRRGDIPALMKSATLLVLPSRWEGMPNVVLEAMASGLPVVATRVDGTAELIENERTGLLISPDNCSELVSAMDRLLANTKLRKDVADSAQHYISKGFTWNRIAAEYAGLFKNLID